MRPVALKVGALARRTGLSVRTLHYYDEIGLLAPSGRTESGHRLYGAEDIVRLQQIASLQHLGLSLAEIRACLDRDGFSPRRVIDLHLGRLRAQIEALRGLCERLEGIARGLEAAGEVSVEVFLETIEELTRMEKYYTPEQLAALAERGRQAGPERLRQVEAEWPALIAEMRAAMEAGTDPADERVQGLARRWQALVEEFTGGDPGIAQALRTMYEQEAAMRERAGVDPALVAYVGKAVEAARAGG